MTLYYADTSAVIRAYFVDEEDHEQLQHLLFDGGDPVVSSELTRVEFASAAAAALRASRVDDIGPMVDLFDADCGEDGPIALLRLEPATVLPLARQLVTEHPLRTLDAIHLAVAMTAASQLAAGEPVIMVTRDRRQAAAARAVGLAVV